MVGELWIVTGNPCGIGGSVSYQCLFCFNADRLLTWVSLKIIGLHYAKRSLMAWVGVKPKDAWPRPLVWHRILKKKIPHQFFFFKKKFEKVGVIPKEGQVQPCEPILHLVWQRLRTLGIFSRNADRLLTWVSLKLKLPSKWIMIVCVTIFRKLP